MLQQTYQNAQNDNQVQTFSLQDVLLYKNKSLIIKFCESYNVTTEEAEDIFTETKKFLYLAANSNNKYKLSNIRVHDNYR